MTFDYDRAAPVYDVHRRSGGPFLPVLLRLADDVKARRVLEVGPGTGNNTGAFLLAHGCSLIGVDRSLGMLRQAQGKAIRAGWVNGDVTALPMCSSTFDFAFGVLVLHHVPNVEQAFAECRRVLRGGGVAAFVTASHEFIERHPMNAYFPSFAAVDKARFPAIPVIESAFRRAGFQEVGVEHTKGAPELIDARYFERVAGQFISTYTLLPRDEFKAGVDRLRRDLHGRDCLETKLEWEAAVVWARA